MARNILFIQLNQGRRFRLIWLTALLVLHFLISNNSGLEVLAQSSKSKTQIYYDRNEYYFHKQYIDPIDKNFKSELEKRISGSDLNFELEKKQIQIDQLKKDAELKEKDVQKQKVIRDTTGLIGLLMFLLALGMFNRYRYIRKTKKIIENEKLRSEKLLLNILPKETAEELKDIGSATPKKYDMVSVLFTDFVNFSLFAEQLSPDQLVAELNSCFIEFDRIIDKHGLEKIKTIGDSYMCAGGLPIKNLYNAIDIVNAGLEISDYIDRLNNEKKIKKEAYCDLRIGIHTGKVISGVVGKNKFAFDIWGDAVNTASRMESCGIPGKVNISGATYELIKDRFICLHRGKVSVKNKGEIDMYIVEGYITPSIQNDL